MILEYIEKAMERAVYEKLEDGTYCGEILDCPGTIAFGKTLFECQKELKSVLEGWIIIGLRHGHEIPVIDNIDLNPKRATVNE
ncbi:MAG: type II toxin-antitoxin system HicB family antitoxin [Acidobacteriota bacterium]